MDALSSAAYGPEAALTLLIPLGVVGISYIIPISMSIIVLLIIVYFSYRQTIQAYPGGGGSYTVARQNLGVSAGLLAAAALIRSTCARLVWSEMSRTSWNHGFAKSFDSVADRLDAGHYRQRAFDAAHCFFQVVGNRL